MAEAATTKATPHSGEAVSDRTLIQPCPSPRSGRIRGPRGAVRPAGDGRVPALPHAPPGRRRRLPGHVHDPGPQSSTGPLADLIGGLAVRGRRGCDSQRPPPGRSPRRNPVRPATQCVVDQSTGADVLEEIARREEVRLFDQELAGLPSRYRLPLLLFYLEGKTRQEVAATLGLKAGTVKSRLERGRNRLRMRLALRGVGLASVAIAIRSSQSEAATCVNASLVSATVISADAAAKSLTIDAYPSADAHDLFHTGIRTMSTHSLATKGLVFGATAISAVVLLAAISGKSGTSRAADGTGAVPRQTNAAQDPFAPSIAEGTQDSNAAASAKGDLAAPPVVVAPTTPCTAAPEDEASSVVQRSSQMLRGVSPVERKIFAELEQPVRSFEFFETALQDVVQTLEDIHQFETHIDRRALESEGMDASVPITIELSGVSFHSALELTLQDLGLTYVVTNEVLLVTTPSRANAIVQLRVYNVADWLTDDPRGTNLVSTLTNVLHQPSDGTQPAKVPAMELVVMGDNLIVRAPYHQQRR